MEFDSELAVAVADLVKTAVHVLAPAHETVWIAPKSGGPWLFAVSSVDKKVCYALKLI